MLSQEEVIRVEVLDDAVEVKLWNAIYLNKPKSIDFLEGTLLACLAVLLRCLLSEAKSIMSFSFLKHCSEVFTTLSKNDRIAFDIAYILFLKR